MTKEKQGKGGVGQAVRRAYQLVAAGLLTAAVVKELRTPASARTWHGDLAGTVPYDLRRPSLRRLRDRTWAPDDPRLFLPRAFGVGWSVNVGRVVRLVRDRLAAR
jgi:hypothetical protein